MKQLWFQFLLPFFVQFNKVLFCSYRLRKCSFKERKWYGFDALNLKTAIILFSNFNLRVTFLYFITNVIIFISGTSRKIRQRDSYTTKPRSKSSTRSLTPCVFICSQYPTQSRRSLLQRLLQLITGQVTFKVFMATKKMIDVNNKASLPFFLGRKNNSA